MRVKLKRLFWARSKLADGTYKDYWYAWKGGPRLRGEPGTPEFIASYNAAVATKIAAPEGRLLRLLQEYQRSQDFLGLRDRTRSDYIGHIKKIEIKFGDMPIKALTDSRARGVFMDWRDELALKSPRQADYTWTVLAAVLAWGKDRGKISVNPCEKGGRVYHRPALIAYGRSRTRRLSSDLHRCIFTCRYYWPYGPVNARVISCGSHGRLMTAASFGCANRRAFAKVRAAR
jgi:hypothetical protein